MAVSENDLLAIEARAQAATGERWRIERESNGIATVLVHHRDGSTSNLRLTHDADPAPAADVAFVAHSRDDLDRLVRAVRGQVALSAEDARWIADRCDRASKGLWRVFLESDGGMGGSNVIWIGESNYAPDLYLWLDSRIAPDEDFVFVAHARQDIPRLLDEVRRRGHGAE